MIHLLRSLPENGVKNADDPKETTLSSCVKPLLKSEATHKAIDKKMFFLKIFLQIKLIFTRKVSHLASFWKWEFLDLERPFSFSLLTDWFSLPLTRENVRALSTFSNVIKCYIIRNMADSLEVGKKRTVTLS